MTNLIIDDGANLGSFALNAAQSNKNQTLIAIEPIPKLAAKLRKSAVELQNLVVIEGAVSSRIEQKDLFISEKSDFGTSSLLNFSAQSRIDTYWNSRNDLVHTSSVIVECRPLSDWLEPWRNSHSVIDFIKIDIQGLDLVALKSLGSNWLNRLQAGMLEASATSLNYLYEEDSLDLHSALVHLDEMGFAPYRIEPNDEGFREYNIYFYRKGIDLESHLASINLDNPIYNGLDIYRQIQIFTDSHSWRFTRPLRYLKSCWQKSHR
jgi:FkbM family methyltransferase